MTEASFIDDEWHCRCGNQTHPDGFYPCLATGQYVEATKEAWCDGDLYRCARCGAIIEFDAIANAGEIIGETEVPFLEMEQP